MAVGSITAGVVADTCYLLDEAAANLDPAKSWIALPRAPWSTARDSDYDALVKTLIHRVRAAGWTGIISVPMANNSGDLSPMAAGDYDTLLSDLAGTTVSSMTLDTNLVWEWHNYGAHYVTGQTTTTYSEKAGWQQVYNDLLECRNGISGLTGTEIGARRVAIWMAEYGQAVPYGTEESGGGTEREREGLRIVATGQYGIPVGQLCPWIMPTWWAIADGVFDSSYALTKGELNFDNEDATDPNTDSTTNPSNQNPGTFPWSDIDGSNLYWLTEGGRAHWDLAHRVYVAPMEVDQQIETLIESWYLIVPSKPELNMKPDVVSFDEVNPMTSVVARQATGAVVASSPPMPARISTSIRLNNQTEREALTAIIESGLEVRLVTILGRSWLVRRAGDVEVDMQRWSPRDGEVTTLADAHIVTVAWEEVSNP